MAGLDSYPFRDLNGLTAHSSSRDFLCRNRSSFRQQSSPFVEAGRRWFRHPFPTNRPGSSRSARDRAAPGRYSARHRPGRNDVAVETVEHLLAALVSMNIDNVLIELNSPEVPIMDGSAAPFIYLIQEAGVKTLQAPRQYLKIIRPIAISRGDKRIALYPVRSLQGHLQHQLRPSAAASSVANAPNHRRELRRRDRAGANVHVPEGRRNAAAERSGARRLAR